MSLTQNKVLPYGTQEDILHEGGSNSVSQYMSAQLIEDSKEICKHAQNPIKLTWNDLNFKVKVEKETADGKKEMIEQEIIKNVSGYAMPGQTLYIMGASGAGKTSLLNILSDRISNING